MRKAMHNKKRILVIVGAFLFALLLTMFLPGTATAAQKVKNTYAVVVTTGKDAGDNVSFCGLQYKDTMGFSHVEYVVPFKGGLQDAFEMVLAGDAYTKETPLSRGKTNTYFFNPTFDVAEIVGLDIYCQGKQGKIQGWDVSGLRIYHVNEIIDLVAGNGSNTIRFNGTQIAHLEERSGSGTSFSWTGNTLFQLRADKAASHQLVFESIPYSMEAESDFAVRLDFADVQGAGLEGLNQNYNQKNALRDAGFGEYMAVQIEYTDIHGDARIVTQPVVKSTINYMLAKGISSDTQIAGFAQQGDTIVFKCTLQDMKEVKAVVLYTGAETNDQLGYGIGLESAAFTGVSVYKDSDVSVSMPTVENYAGGPEYIFAADPLFYYTSVTTDGETVPENNSHYISMRPYEKGAALKPVSQTEKYLIELFAASSQITGVPKDVEVTLQYVDLSGNVRESEAFSVRQYAKEFYGYWPASKEDFAYLGQINNEETGIAFVAELPQVEHFTNLRVAIPDGKNDWQMAGFRITRLDTLSKRFCVWEDVVAQSAASNRRYYRNTEGYVVFSLNEKALIQPGNDYEFDFVSKNVQQVEDFDWRDYLYAMSYEQCMANLGLAKVRENYTVEVQVQSGTTSLLDGYGDNGSKNRFYFLLEFENGDSGYVLANQQLSADGFRSGCTESFQVSTNYDYGELVAVHVIPDDVSEDSDPYDKLNIAQIRVRRNDSGTISKEWVVQNVGWIGIDYRDEGASSTITGQMGRVETEIARSYPVSYSTYALNLEFRMGIGTYNESGSGGAFYGTMEGTLEYYDKNGKRNQMTFDVIRAMYEYANKSPIYLNDGTTGSTGSPLAITDNSFMFRQNHTDRFVISVSDVSKLGKLTLNMKSLNGGSLEITNVSAALVIESGLLEINEQDEYTRLGSTEYLCEDTVDRIPAFELTLPTDRNIYQEIYFTEHEGIQLDTENNTWISTVTRVPNSKNDSLNIYVYTAENASGSFTIDVRAQYTDVNGTVLETGATGLKKGKDADGNTVYAAKSLTASGMSTLNKVYVKAQSASIVDAYIDHIIVQQVRSGVVINTFLLDCEHRNAENEFYVLPSNVQIVEENEQKVTLSLGKKTEAANLVSENRDIAVALKYTTNNGGDTEYTSKYIYITDQQYDSIKAGDIIELTFNESYVRKVTGLLIATTGNVKAQVTMAMVDNYIVDAVTGTKQLLKHFSFPTGATVKNEVITLEPSTKTTVEAMDIQFTTALADAQLESGTTAPIAMVVGYNNSQGVLKEVVYPDIREYVTSEGTAFATGSVTRIRVLLRDIASAQYLKLMPYDEDPKVKAVWKLSEIVVSVGTDGSLQTVNRSVNKHIYENTELDPDETITSEMIGGLKINLANILLAADVTATNEAGTYGSSRRVTSTDNKTLAMTVPSGVSLQVKVDISNTEQGYAVKAEQADGLRDISGLVEETEDGFTLELPEDETEQTYRITISSSENEDVSVVIEVTVKGEKNTNQPDSGDKQPDGGDNQPDGGDNQPEGGDDQPNGGENQPDGDEEQPDGDEEQPNEDEGQPDEDEGQPDTETSESTT